MSDSRKTSFDSIAEQYDRARPRYPAEMLDDIVALAPLSPRVLEVGCGTGKLSVDLAVRGCRLTCVELGANLARIASTKLEPFDGCGVEIGAFESWDPHGRCFDMIAAASSWHWIDPEVGYAKAARLLDPGGALVILRNRHAFPPGYDHRFEAIHVAYVEADESSRSWPPPSPDEIADQVPEIEATGLFQSVTARRYLWSRDYSAREYTELLGTYSDHIVMSPERRARLIARIEETIGERMIRKHYLSIVHVARVARR